jgi:hypothetical protein
MRGSSSVFGAARAVSDNTERMSINSTDPNRARSANRSSFTVDITQVAQAQRNEGEALQASANAAGAGGFTAGSHQMTLQSGGRSFNVSFNVSQTDTVRDVQNKMASAINSTNSGVRASVSFNNDTGESTIVLQSERTGVERANQPNFTLNSTVGNASQVTGANNVTQEAQNAQFRVNRGFTGTMQTSRSNEVDLGFGVNATLNQTGQVQVNMQRNETAQINAFRDMVNQFNGMLDAARSGSDRLQRELNGLVRTHSHTLRNAGISMNSDGRMQIDEARMDRAAQSGALERLATDRAHTSSGFVNRLSRIADNAARNPGSFVDRNNQQQQSMPWWLNQMNSMNSTGLLFDAFM